MEKKLAGAVAEAKEVALEVLRHNRKGPYRAMFRTAGWGYPEPYTRDIMIATPGILLSGDEELIYTLRRVLEALAKNQSPRGHIPSLAHDPENRGASDTTPLFLLGLAMFRKAIGEPSFLEDAARAALTWMEYQSPEDRVLVAQQPTSDWRDEQWVPGHGLFVNTVYYACLRLYGCHDQADELSRLMHRFGVTNTETHGHVHRGLALAHKPYFALWSYKEYGSERFDLLGNSLAVLTGLAAPTRASRIISWVEGECEALRRDGELTLELPPCLFPYFRPGDPDWRSRCERYNQPGHYHNGGVWPFICGFYVAAGVAAGRQRIAEQKLAVLTELVRQARNHELRYGFNEWFHAGDGTPRGQDWQTWSAAMYLYAANAVERGETPFFDAVRACPKDALSAEKAK